MPNVTGLEVPASMAAQGLETAYWMHKSHFRHLHQMDSKNSATTPNKTAEDKVNIIALLCASESFSEAALIISSCLVEKLSRTLSMPGENINPLKPMHFLGVDSLVALEIRNWFIKEVEVDITVFEILGNESIADLSLEAARRCRHCHHCHGVDEKH